MCGVHITEQNRADLGIFGYQDLYNISMVLGVGSTACCPILIWPCSGQDFNFIKNSELSKVGSSALTEIGVELQVR